MHMNEKRVHTIVSTFRTADEKWVRESEMEEEKKRCKQRQSNEKQKVRFFYSKFFDRWQ